MRAYYFVNLVHAVYLEQFPLKVVTVSHLACLARFTWLLKNDFDCLVVTISDVVLFKVVDYLNIVSVLFMLCLKLKLLIHQLCLHSVYLSMVYYLVNLCQSDLQQYN